MRCAIGFFCSIVVVMCWTFSSVAAQQPAATPPADPDIRIPTEEVQLTLHAQGAYKGFAPKLRPEDIIVYEDSVQQTVTAMRTVPARVVLLVDTGAGLTFTKDRETSLLATSVVLANLPEGTSSSVIQYSDRAETISDWTEKTTQAIDSARTGLRTGRRSLLSLGLKAALDAFALQPGENRHLVLITDGLDGGAALDTGSATVRALTAANVVVHVISYSAIEQARAKEAARVVKLNMRRSKPRVPKEIFDDMIRSLPIPVEAKEHLKTMNEAQQIVIIDLDRERRAMLRARREEWANAEVRLRELSTETGGEIAASADESQLIMSALDVARSIGSHYLVTYTPSRPISGSATNTNRAVTVAARSDAIKVRTRKTIVVRSQP